VGWKRTCLLNWRISFLIIVNFFKNVLISSMVNIFQPRFLLFPKSACFFKGLLSFVTL
jgi:hypothetical protein